MVIVGVEPSPLSVVVNFVVVHIEPEHTVESVLVVLAVVGADPAPAAPLGPPSGPPGTPVAVVLEPVFVVSNVFLAGSYGTHTCTPFTCPTEPPTHVDGVATGGGGGRLGSDAPPPEGAGVHDAPVNTTSPCVVVNPVTLPVTINNVLDVVAAHPSDEQEGAPGITLPGIVAYPV